MQVFPSNFRTAMAGVNGICTSELRLLAPIVSVLVLLLLLLLPLPLPKLPWPPCQCQTQFAGESGYRDYGDNEDKGNSATHTGRSDLEWLHQQVQPLSSALAGARDGSWLLPRKGINPRSRHQQLLDLRRYHGITHYDNNSRIRMEIPAPLLIEPHHSYYGEPWAGGRDVFEYLAMAVRLQPHHKVLEVGCGTLRVGLHFIRFLHESHFFCWEKDALSLAAALLYELPANGLLRKRPSLILAEENPLPESLKFDLVYASAVFLHMPDAEVWKSVEALGLRLAGPARGRLFVSHNIKFCTRLSMRVCETRLRRVGLVYIGKQTHDSLLFNHFEVWHEFRRVPL